MISASWATPSAVVVVKKLGAIATVNRAPQKYIDTHKQFAALLVFLIA
jgi:hypothetical protein